MKTIIIRTSLAATLAACGVLGCSSAGTEEPQTFSQSEAFVAEIPATSGVLGAAVWRFTLEEHGGRAWAVDASGAVVADFRLTQSEDDVTILDLITQERVVIGAGGGVIETTVSEGSLMPSVLDSVAGDVEVYRRDNPQQPLSCGWDFAKMWGWCAATAGTCNHVLGWACVATGASCVNAAGDFYYNCLSS
jgi:hypothetical protein